MAATVISLRFRTKHRRSPISSPSFLHRFSFSSSSTPSDSSTNAEDQNTPSSPPPPQPQSQSQSPFSSYFSDVKARLKQIPPHQQQRRYRNPPPCLEEIPKNLAEFSHCDVAPPPGDTSSQQQQQQPFSFQELYERRSENSAIEASNKGGGGHIFPFEAVRQSLSQLSLFRENGEEERSPEIVILFHSSGLTSNQWRKLKNLWSPGRTLFRPSCGTGKKKRLFAQLAHSAGPTCILYLPKEASDRLELLPSLDSMDQDLLLLYGQYRSTLVDHMDLEKASHFDELETSFFHFYLPMSYLSFVCSWEETESKIAGVIFPELRESLQA